MDKVCVCGVGWMWCGVVCVNWHLYSSDIIIRQLVTSPFKSIYFWSFLQKLLSQNYRSYNYENSTKWKQIDLRNKHFIRSVLVSVVIVPVGCHLSPNSH